MTTVDELAVHIGRFLHSPIQCKGTHCTFHNPSEHGMRDWPVLLRETALIERLCKHGVGHPDPDSAAWKDRQMGHDKGTWSVHGCDGCCGDGYQQFGEPCTRCGGRNTGESWCDGVEYGWCYDCGAEYT